jgi:hypothetical protein
MHDIQKGAPWCRSSFDPVLLEIHLGKEKLDFKIIRTKRGQKINGMFAPKG